MTDSLIIILGQFFLFSELFAKQSETTHICSDHSLTESSEVVSQSVKQKDNIKIHREQMALDEVNIHPQN